ncbi:hypothetical protein Xsze_03730 [Xenorhabdus szentirmaii DSM 16338]|nr:hypothetical protein Xsze_03730 [Xenorhabdus szentirmaii DSM 16338]
MGVFSAGWQRFQHQLPKFKHVLLGSIVQGQHHLKNGAVAQAAGRLQRLDQLFKGQILMGIGRLGMGFHLRQQCPDGGVIVQPDPERQRIGEETDERLQFTVLPVSDGGADDNVGLAAEAGKQDRPRGGQCHEKCCAVPLAQGFQVTAQCRGQGKGNLIPLIALYRRPRPVRRQFKQGGCPVQGVAPEIHLFFQPLAL